MKKYWTITELRRIAKHGRVEDNFQVFSFLEWIQTHPAEVEKILGKSKKGGEDYGKRNISQIQQSGNSHSS